MLQTVSLYTVFTNNSARKSGPPKYISEVTKSHPKGDDDIKFSID